ncbi:hypothetical protein BDN67DRAFT_973930 [Paxillus ammoniavirescens]|nr:hypothetical protein BDN67DRAFT_973930 [Paxillus ammoniavirescens]
MGKTHWQQAYKPSLERQGTVVGVIALQAASLVVLLVVGCAAAMALRGNIDKLRAQYTPSNVLVQLGSEKCTGAPAGGSITKSYWGMIKRVYRLEGWRGQLKGIIPSLVISNLFLLVDRIHLLPPLNPVLEACLAIAFLVPSTILTTRVITTNEMLRFFDVRRALRVLFSPAERRQPWLLYLTPGVLPAKLIHPAWAYLSVKMERAVIRLVEDREFFDGVSTVTLVGLGFVLLRAAVVTPVDVISVRLAIQRNRPAVELEGDSSDVNSEKLLTKEEQVLNLRTDLDMPHYTGLLDCVRCIIKEEGFWVLYRTWWYTSLVFLSILIKSKM